VPVTPHTEKHFTGSENVHDIVIGMSDGLTVPFALAAGLTGVVAANGIIVTAGLAEIAAGSIAMGLGGYLAAKSDTEHYRSERRREEREIVELPKQEESEITDIFRAYGIGEEESRSVVTTLSRKPKEWVDFMMRFELGLEEPNPRRALVSALTIAGSYVAGGFIPLAPYMIFPQVGTALWISISITLAALLLFGFVKGRFTGTSPLRSALQTMCIGGIAAAAAFGLARLIS